MKYCLLLFATVLMLSITHLAFSSPYFENTVEDQAQANSLLKDPTKFRKYILENDALNNARKLLAKGQMFYFKENDVFEGTDDSQGRCKVICDYITKTKSVIVFSSNFSQTANAYFQQGKQVVVGKWKDKDTNKIKDIISFHENVIWISDRYKKSPAIIAMLIAHEVGHGLYREYKSNRNNVFPGEPGDVPGEVCEDSLTSESFEEYIAYAREGAIVDELRLSSIFNNLCDAKFYETLTPKAKEKFRELFGDIKPRSLEYLKTEIRYISEVKRCFRGYSSQKRKCGMPCKYFKEYKLCDNPVLFPPCRQWATHLESLQEGAP